MYKNDNFFEHWIFLCFDQRLNQLNKKYARKKLLKDCLTLSDRKGNTIYSVDMSRTCSSQIIYDSQCIQLYWLFLCQ